jgi:hypothetical protein
MNEEILIEEWREYNGYRVSNYGKVINKHGKYLSTKPAKDGYVPTSIKGIDGTYISGLHRIVATVFLPNPNNLPEVNHLDGKKHNNKVDNLVWCTKKENQDHASYILGKRIGSDCYKHKLTEKEVLDIYELCKEGKLTYKEIGADYGVSEYSISYIALGKSWKHLKLEPIKVVRGSRKNQFIDSKTKQIST